MESFCSCVRMSIQFCCYLTCSHWNKDLLLPCHFKAFRTISLPNFYPLTAKKEQTRDDFIRAVKHLVTSARSSRGQRPACWIHWLPSSSEFASLEGDRKIQSQFTGQEIWGYEWSYSFCFTIQITASDKKKHLQVSPTASQKSSPPPNPTPATTTTPVCHMQMYLQWCVWHKTINNIHYVSFSHSIHLAASQ